MKKVNLKVLFEDNRFLWVFSLILAMLIWVFVITTESTDATRHIKGVPVDLNIADSSLSSMGLNDVDNLTRTVDVTVRGSTLVVGNLQPSDVEVTAVLTGVNGAGTHELKLNATDKYGKGFTALSISPETIVVTFDRMVTKRVPIQADVSNVSYPEGYVMENETITPAEVVITGPETEISRVERCVARVDAEGTLAHTETFAAKLELQDREGAGVQSKYITADVNSAEVTVPVLKLKEVPLGIEFTNVPKGFPLEDLEYEFSTPSILVAGPEEAVDNCNNINLGYIDMKDLDVDYGYSFEVTLPAGFANIDGTTTVEVSFENEEMETRYLSVSDIRVVNRLSDYNVVVNTKVIPNVKVIGPKSVLSTMTARDVIAEVDLSGMEYKKGQFKVPVNISIPTKGLVWASGSYQVQISLQAK